LIFQLNSKLISESCFIPIDTGLFGLYPGFEGKITCKISIVSEFLSYYSLKLTNAESNHLRFSFLNSCVSSHALVSLKDHLHN